MLSAKSFEGLARLGHQPGNGEYHYHANPICTPIQFAFSNNRKRPGNIDNGISEAATGHVPGRAISVIGISFLWADKGLRAVSGI